MQAWPKLHERNMGPNIMSVQNRGAPHPVYLFQRGHSSLESLPLVITGTPIHQQWDTLYFGFAPLPLDVGEGEGFAMPVGWHITGNPDFLGNGALDTTILSWSAVDLTSLNLPNGLVSVFYDFPLVTSLNDPNSLNFEQRWGANAHPTSHNLVMERCVGGIDPWVGGCINVIYEQLNGNGLMPDTFQVPFHPNRQKRYRFAGLGQRWIYAVSHNQGGNPVGGLMIGSPVVSAFPLVPWPRQNSSPAVIVFNDGRGSEVKLEIEYTDILFTQDGRVPGGDGRWYQLSGQQYNAIIVNRVILEYPLPDTLNPGEGVSYGYHPYPDNLVGDWAPLGGFMVRALDTVVLVEEQNNVRNGVRLYMPVLYNPLERKAVIVTPQGVVHNGEVIEVRVVDALGRTLWGGRYTGREIRNGKIEVDVFRQLRPGNYFMDVRRAHGEEMRQRIVKKVFVP